MRIAVIGLGYVGCVAAGKLCAAGHKVLGVDISEEKVRLVNMGKPTVIEPGLDELFATAKKQGNLHAVSDVRKIIHEVDVFYLCVGTPLKSGGDLDLSSIFHVVEKIASALESEGPRKTLIIRSTVKPGTCAVLSQILKEKNISVVMNPEFLREGSAICDWDSPGLIVIGAFDEHGKNVTKELHVGVSGQVFYVRPETAEAIKYVNNSWHALKVAFANEIGRLSQGFKIDHEELMKIFLADKKLNISEYYLRPGLPYGGSCLPKDLSALTVFAKEKNMPVPVLESVAKTNAYHISYIVDMICKYKEKKIGILGLSFKRATDDLRNSPSVEIIRGLLKQGLDICIFDENVRFEQLKGQNKEQVSDILPILEKAFTPTLDTMLSQVNLVVVTHDIGGRMEDLRRSYPDKIFLDMFRFRTRDFNHERQQNFVSSRHA